jgi:hypothetical protein
MVDAKDHQRILIAAFDAMHDQVGQSGHNKFASAGLTAFVSHVRERHEKIDCFFDSATNTPCGVRISVFDVFSDRVEMPA